MSLVQAYISDECIVVGGEGRAKFDDGTIDENFQKVFKFNDTIIVGIAGTISGNAFLFKDYINSDFSLTSLAKESTYEEVISHLKNIFENEAEFLNKHSIKSIVCGWDGEKMTGKTFFTKCENPELDGINDLTSYGGNKFRVVNCGLDVHYQNALKHGKYTISTKPIQAKNIFKSVIIDGLELDDTINDNIKFEKIKRSDVI